MQISDQAISIFANTTVGINSLFAMAAMIYLGFKIRTKASKESLLLAFGLFVLSVGELVRIGYWAPAMFFATDSLYHSWFFEHRVVAYFISMPLLIAGTWVVLWSLFDGVRRWINIAMLASIAIGLFVGLAYEFSVYGAWDRIEWVNRLLGE